ncbi:hypothetical protein [Fundidesulfovibrio terrae]|uniref:hypothetical protein n=1 Tax=Fundidesulfovibrio terrae TaxID=2922866 RepID=UPI001FAED3C3|nr:hypothetical protein [Fundidesulfovibrio terrae]
MKRTLALLKACTFLLAVLTAGAALAGQRITDDDLQWLRERTENRRGAWVRLDLAEREALEEGSPERAEAFRDAKARAYEAYMALDKELRHARAAKAEQDKRQAEQGPER